MGILGGLAALVVGGLAAGGASEMPIGGLVMLLGFIAIAIYLGILIVGHFLWKGFNWARITFMVLLALSALQCVPGLVTGLRYGVIGGLILPVLQIGVCVLFIVILNGREAQEYCTR